MNEHNDSPEERLAAARKKAAQLIQEEIRDYQSQPNAQKPLAEETVISTDKLSRKETDIGADDYWVVDVDRVASQLQKAGIVGTKDFIDNILQPKELVEMWGDLVTGHATNLDDFGEHLQAYLDQRLTDNIKAYDLPMGSQGLEIQPVRPVRMYMWKDVTTSVYLATQGDDLYMSHRTFIKQGWSIIKIVSTVIAYFLVMLLLYLLKEAVVGTDIWTGETNNVSVGFPEILIALFVSVGFPIWWGISSPTGNPLMFWRRPAFSIYLDEAIALTKIIHSGFLYAADRVGIDRSKLQQREPFYQQGRRSPMI